MQKVYTLVPKSFGSNTYYVTNGEQSFLVDPSVSVNEAKAMLSDAFIPPTAILLTHGHFDHVEALPEWYAAYRPTVYIGREDAPMLSDGYLNAYEFFFFEKKTFYAPHETLSEGSELSLLGEKISVYSYPGHTPGGLVYRMSDIAFVGDLVFEGGGYGRYDLPGGNGGFLFDSLRRAAEELKGITLYPGHGNPFKL